MIPVKFTKLMNQMNRGNYENRANKFNDIIKDN